MVASNSETNFVNTFKLDYSADLDHEKEDAAVSVRMKREHSGT